MDNSTFQVIEYYLVILTVSIF